MSLSFWNEMKTDERIYILMLNLTHTLFRGDISFLFEGYARDRGVCLHGNDALGSTNIFTSFDIQIESNQRWIRTANYLGFICSHFHKKRQRRYDTIVMCISISFCCFLCFIWQLWIEIYLHIYILYLCNLYKVRKSFAWRGKAYLSFREDRSMDTFISLSYTKLH